MIKNIQATKKQFSKYKLNLLEKYIASKTIQKRTRPSQLNFHQRTIFTETITHQEPNLTKFKTHSPQRSCEIRSQTKKQSERYPDCIFMKEDLIKLSKINDDNRSECKVTKISMLLKKLVNQQIQAQDFKTQNQKENVDQNREVPKQKNLKTVRSKQISNLFQLNSNVNFNLIEENLIQFKNQQQQECSLHYNTTNRKNHVRYASTVSKLKLKYKAVEHNCLDTLKVLKCEMKQINAQHHQKKQQHQKNRQKLSKTKQNSPRDEMKMDPRMELKGKDQVVIKKEENLKKLPKMATYRKSQSHTMMIEPWNHDQIIIYDPIDMQD